VNGSASCITCIYLGSGDDQHGGGDDDAYDAVDPEATSCRTKEDCDWDTQTRGGR
jgi:hypothetical protein